MFAVTHISFPLRHSQINTVLIESKNRVELFQKISLLSLVPCGALLLYRLMHYTDNVLQLYLMVGKLSAYTNSTIYTIVLD